MKTKTSGFNLGYQKYNQHHQTKLTANNHNLRLYKNKTIKGYSRLISICLTMVLLFVLAFVISKQTIMDSLIIACAFGLGLCVLWAINRQNFALSTRYYVWKLWLQLVPVKRSWKENKKCSLEQFQKQTEAKKKTSSMVFYITFVFCFLALLSVLVLTFLLPAYIRSFRI